MRSVTFSAAVFCLIFLAGGCVSPTCINIEEAGRSASFMQTKRDPAGRVILDLSGRAHEVRYRHFSIRNPRDPRLAVLVSENTPDLAIWTLANPSPDYSFQGRVVCERLPFIVRSTKELKPYYEKMHKKNKQVIRYTIKEERRGDLPVITFESHSRRTNGQMVISRGFAMLDPVNPEYLLEASATTAGYEPYLAADDLKGLDTFFIDLVQVEDPFRN